MVDGTSRVRDCGLPEEVFRAVERDDLCPAMSVQSTTCGIERNGFYAAVPIDGRFHVPTGRLGQFVCPAFDAKRIIEDRSFCPALHDWNDGDRDGIGLDVGPKNSRIRIVQRRMCHVVAPGIRDGIFEIRRIKTVALRVVRVFLHRGAQQVN